MTDIPVSRERFSGFTEDERDVIHFALQQCAKRIMDKAAADEFAEVDLTSAAGTYHLAATLGNEVEATIGEGPGPVSPETIDAVAACIAEGEAPFAARMTAEAVAAAPFDAPAPLGWGADVQVTPGEDEAAA